jgi:hypothetical protein
MLSTSAVLGAGLWGLSPVAAALAEDAAEVAAEVLADPDSFLGLTQTGAVFATAPVILYGAFTVIRQEVYYTVLCYTIPHRGILLYYSVQPPSLVRVT